MTGTVRYFDLGDILSVVTQSRVSTRGREAAYGVISFMMRDPELDPQDMDLFRDAVRLEILSQHPELARVKAPWMEASIESDGTVRSIADWLAEQKELYGDNLPIGPMSVETLTYASNTLLQRALRSATKEDPHL